MKPDRQYSVTHSAGWSPINMMVHEYSHSKCEWFLIVDIMCVCFPACLALLHMPLMFAHLYIVHLNTWWVGMKKISQFTLQIKHLPLSFAHTHIHHPGGYVSPFRTTHWRVYASASIISNFIFFAASAHCVVRGAVYLAPLCTIGMREVRGEVEHMGVVAMCVGGLVRCRDGYSLWVSLHSSLLFPIPPVFLPYAHPLCVQFFWLQVTWPCATRKCRNQTFTEWNGAWSMFQGKSLNSQSFSGSHLFT